ncbi:inner centromere protein isoform X2 [Lutzomyia longipalpis]|uniref:inner centromere protein isoform X2 n=1 Tax=Lutzomyia longipalpis TaxID=7200 RepID=UPI002483CEC8|nr:inner centromere protein isoform X2 [Lutzomyia longipalpis]
MSEENKCCVKKDNLAAKENAAVAKEREDRIRMVRERQNEERQRKLEELKAQALAAQRFREQKEEERRRRLEESRSRDFDRRHQVEERKKAIQDAERERREYLLRKNQEREARFESKRRNERSSIVFAFGSSTPRLLDPGEMGTVSPSQFWNHRRATSISNIAYSGAPLTRRSSERELNEAPKKRATSATALDRQREDYHRTSNSMYEVFNWGYANDERRPCKKLQLSIAGPSINIDDPGNYKSNHDGAGIVTTNDSPTVSYRNVARRKTDLMPTVPSPRDGTNYGSRSSLGSHTPRSPGRAVSMTRLDQLARPVRRNGEHICAILERERREEIALNSGGSSPIHQGRDLRPRSSSERKIMSKSMIHLASTKCRKSFPPVATGISHGFVGDGHTSTITRRSPLKLSRRLRSGEVTPGGTLSSRPNSAMSNSTVVSSTVSRRSTMTPRKPRPASIAVTGVSLPNGNNADGHKGSVKQEKPPLPKVTAQMKKSAAISSSLMTRSLDLSGKKSLERTPLKSRGSSKTATPLMSPGTEKEIKMPSEKPTQSQTPKIEKPVKQVVNKEEVHDVAKQEEVVKEELKKEVQKKEDVKEEEPKNEVKEEPLVITEEVDNKEVVVKQEVTENGVKEEQITTVTAEIENDVEQSNEQEDPSDVMSTSMMSKSRITTEEEAKAALAERRRLARVEAERQAEAERLRLIAEAEAEQKRIAEEEEKQRQLEQEALRLAEEQRKAEEERLARAIEEARKREEEEKLQREAEARQKAEREEQEKKAREEAEKLRLQTAERLKKEEIEREERRKRVEAIMLRTRTKGSVSGTPTKGSGDEKASNDAKEDTSNSGSGQEQTKQETESSHNQTKNIPSINNQPDTVTEKAQMEQQQMSYEKSVTEKENSLLGSFTHIVDGINNKSNHIHGQSVIGDGHQENVLIPDVINNKVLNNSTENGFKNSGVDNILSSVDCTNNVVDSKVLAMNQDNAKQPDQQLIDFDSLPQQQQIEDVFNYNNNNDRANTTSAIPSLVTADSQENRDISLF